MRLKILVFSICIFAIGIIQSTILDYIKIYNVKPNLLLVLVITFALLYGSGSGAVLGFFAGLIQDLISGKVLGFYSLLGLYLGLFVGLVNRRIFRENLVVTIFITFVSTTIYEELVYIINSVFTRGKIDMIYPALNIVLPEALYNSVAAILIYVFVLKLDEKLDRVGKGSKKYW
jgi:rod shape-determining protein MreD